MYGPSSTGCSDGEAHGTRPPGQRPEPALRELSLLHRDERIIAVSKPAGVVTIPGRGELSCAQIIIATQLGLPWKGEADPRIRVVHRLDKDTTGVLLFALDLAAQRHLSMQFQNNRVQKEYLALVTGRPAGEEGEIDAPIGVDRRRPDRMSVTRLGKPARTRWRIEETFRGLTLLRCFPLTGKTHQIRVHLQHIGCPLVVDELYAPAPAGETPGVLLSRYKRGYRLGKFAEERPLMARLTLHAHRIAFDHPAAGPVQYECPLPKDFLATLNMLRKYARA